MKVRNVSLRADDQYLAQMSFRFVFHIWEKQKYFIMINFKMLFNYGNIQKSLKSMIYVVIALKLRMF